MANSPKTQTSIIAGVIDADAGLLTLTFLGGGVFVVDVATLSPEIRHYATLHGLKAKLVDAAAIARNLDTGKSATVADKLEAVQEVFDRITSTNGSWNKVRGTGEGAATSNGLLLRALVALTGKQAATIKADLESSSDDEKKALRNMPKIAAKMAELRGLASDVDTDALAEKFGF